MNSFNHYAYGAIGEWLYQHLAGLKTDPQNPGYKHSIISPHPGGGLTAASAEILSLYGLVKSAWEINNNTIICEVIIPANTTATIILPRAKAQEVMINSSPLRTLEAQTFIQKENELELELGSGSYQFSYPLSER